jgi:hypothetical protein
LLRFLLLSLDVVPHLSRYLGRFIFTRAIVAFLDRETTKLDTLIDKSRRSIDLMREHRTALTSAAVTGKIDVREAA